MKSYETIADESNFQTGIAFNVKLIGSMEISRPTSRVEIVAAMRRVRFEFKAKGVKKKKVTVTISTDSICTTLRTKSKRKRRTRSSSQVQYKDVDKNNVVLIHHPIYRIFYVCHDSQDVKIFSYISRETSSNVFNCSVFKASKKSQALRIVKTVGEAFEVSHKLTASPESNDDNDVFIPEKTLTPKKEAGLPSTTSSEQQVTPPPPSPTVTPTVVSSSVPLLLDEPKEIVGDPELEVEDEDEEEERMTSGCRLKEPESSEYHNKSTKEHEVQLLKEKLDAQTQNTQAALAQIHLLRDQLAAESNARIEAQTRTHQLLQQNRELLDHLQSLMRHIHELEVGGQQKCSLLPSTQHVPLPQVQQQLRSGSPSSTSTATPPFSSFQELDSLRRQNLYDSMYFENRYRVPYYTPPFGFFNGGFARDFYQPTPSYLPPQPPLSQNYAQPPPPSQLAHPSAPLPSSHPPPPANSTHNTPSLEKQEQLAKSMAAQFILPIDSSLHHQQPQQLLPVPKLGQIGRKTSAEVESKRPPSNTLGRSVSEKVKSQSELMSQTRNAWARHTTK